MLDGETCYRALVARDRRFDGLFFVAVRSTRIYCRPVCTARTPGRSSCTFHATAAECERAGYRACLRCRPELAPGRAAVDAVPRLIAAAVARVEAGALDEGSVDDLARELGVGARHLRRASLATLGVTPVELAQTRRLALAKRLLTDTTLPVTDVALASGYRSVRRFNASFRERTGIAPSRLRGRRAEEPTIPLRLDYRPPHALAKLFGFLAARAVPGVEEGGPASYARTLRLRGRAGIVTVEPHPALPALLARVSLGLAPVVGELVPRLRAMFDLDAQPAEIDACLGRDPLLRPSVRASPGLRVPGAFDPFELAVRAVLGQQVSVAAARTLAGRLAARWGAPLESASGTLLRLFPDAATLAEAGEAAIATIGLPRARARSLHGLAVACAGGALALSPAAPLAELAAALEVLPGLGPWTAQYVAMRALRHPDAFPASDLGVRKALAMAPPPRVLDRAEAWRPWRSYAVMHLWSSLG